MSLYNIIEKKVAALYGQEDLNCAVTTLLILAEVLEVDLNSQVLDAAVGMDGETKYSGQCGLLEGCLMFIGIYGRKIGMSDGAIIESCGICAVKFEAKFGSMKCVKLRPGSVHSEGLPPICEPLTRHGIEFAVTFIKSLKG